MIGLSLATPLHLHLTKAGVKAWLYAHELQGVWQVARDYLLDYRIWLLAVVPCLLLETFLPAMMESDSRHASRWLDFSYPIFGGLLLAPFTGLLLAGVDQFYRAHLPFLNTGLLDNKPAIVQIIGSFLILDFASYLSHYLRHRVKWLWYFHAIHHSQENLNPFTANRAHFFEAVISTVIRTIPIAFFGGSPMNWTLFIALSGTWTYFIHSNVRTNLGLLRFLLVTPQFHRVHHSRLPEHFDKNFCERLVIWDWLFGTVVRDSTIYPPTGVPGMESWAVEGKTSARAIATAWFGQTAYPFVKIWESVRDALRRRLGGPTVATVARDELEERRAGGTRTPAFSETVTPPGRQRTSGSAQRVTERSA